MYTHSYRDSRDNAERVFVMIFIDTVASYTALVVLTACVLVLTRAAYYNLLEREWRQVLSHLALGSVYALMGVIVVISEILPDK
jgi:uncharacterized membrane protein